MKSFALCWLLHLVGDVHQPLHTAARFSRDLPDGDRGGNSVLLPARNGDKDTLHLYWDRPLGDSEDPRTALALAAALPPPVPALARIDDEATWIDEGFALARSAVYVPPVGPGAGPYTLDGAYAERARAVASLRVALAGARLARLLDRALR